MFKSKFSIIPLALFGIVVAIVAVYLLVAINWSYSDGERVGYVQKFSRKGWLCKTWEGELAMVPIMALQAEKFTFTVRDEAVAKQITAGMGRKMALHYEEHKGVPSSCFGDTPYWITEIKILE